MGTTEATTCEDVEQSVRQPLSRGAVCLGKPELRRQCLPTPECPRAVQTGAGGADLLRHHRRPREHLLRPRDSADLPVHRDLRGLQQRLPSSWWLDSAPRSRSLAVPASRNGAIMFPDIYSEQSGCSVGLVLVDGLVSKDARNQLLSLLEQHTALKTSQQLPADQQLGKVGSSIVWGAEKLAVGIEMGAEKAGELIEYVTEAAEKRLSKSDEGAKVGALTKNSVKVAVTATDATVKVSGYVADRVGNLTKRMASYLAAKVV